MASVSSKMTIDVTKFDVDYHGIGEMLKSHDVRAELTGRAEKVLAQAKSTAPVVSGDYQSGLHIVQLTTDRAVVEVQGGSDHDWEVEAATGNLGRALDAAK